MPARPLVLIDEELLAPRGHARRGDERDRYPGLVALNRRTVMRRVGLALHETPEVPELALADRNRHVSESRGGLDLLHEARRRLAHRLGHRVRPRVLRLQVCAHLGVIAVAQPIPRVIKMLSELVAHPIPITFRGHRGSVWRGLGFLSRGRLSHGDHLRGGDLRGVARGWGKLCGLHIEWFLRKVARHSPVYLLAFDIRSLEFCGLWGGTEKELRGFRATFDQERGGGVAMSTY